MMIDSAVFTQVTTECPYTLLRALLSPKIALPMGDLDAYLIHDSLGSPEFSTHLDRFSRFCRAHYCDRPIDRQTYRLRSV